MDLLVHFLVGRLAGPRGTDPRGADEGTKEMDLQLAGKRALVTGSSSGLGAGIAAMLGAEGAAVVVHGRDESRTKAVAEGIQAVGGSAVVAIGALDTDHAAGQVAAAALAGGPIDILVNNAGVFDIAKTWATTSADDWADMYNVNVLSSVRLIEKLVPAMRERGWGRVIQIGSVNGILPMASQPHYGATSTVRNYLSQSLARDLRESGVTANTVAPGGMLTDSSKSMLTEFGRANGLGESWEEMETAVVRALAPNDIGRIARLDEIAAAVTYLASPRADYITGEVIRLDGNWYLPA